MRRMIALFASVLLAMAMLAAPALADEIPWEEPGDPCFGIQNVVTNPGDARRHANMNEDAKDRLVALVSESCEGAVDGDWWAGHPDDPIGEWTPPGLR